MTYYTFRKTECYVKKSYFEYLIDFEYGDPCAIEKDSLAYQIYGSTEISERHRHRYEVNNDYIEIFEKHGLFVSGNNPKTNLVEIMELSKDQHPYFIGTQAHPEFKSRLTHAAPLFKGLITAAISHKKHNSEVINKV